MVLSVTLVSLVRHGVTDTHLPYHGDRRHQEKGTSTGGPSVWVRFHWEQSLRNDCRPDGNGRTSRSTGPTDLVVLYLPTQRTSTTLADGT